MAGTSRWERSSLTKRTGYGAGRDMGLQFGGESVVVAVSDPLGFGENGFWSGAGQRRRAVRTGGYATSQVAAEQGGRDAGDEPVGDRWGRAAYYGFLQSVSRPGWAVAAWCRATHGSVLSGR